MAGKKQFDITLERIADPGLPGGCLVAQTVVATPVLSASVAARARNEHGAAAGGQGAAQAEALVREGARVIAVPADGCRRLDMSGEQDWAEPAAEPEEFYGQVHGLANNVGVTRRARLGEVRPSPARSPSAAPTASFGQGPRP